MKQLALNDVSVNTIIAELKKILEFSFELNGRKEIGGKVTLHPMIKAQISKFHPYRTMILFSYNGSCALYWCENDVFEFGDDGSIKVTAFHDKKIENGKVVPATKKYNFKSIKLTKKQEYNLNEDANMNKRFSDDYWASVRQDMAEKMERDSDFGFDEY